MRRLALALLVTVAALAPGLVRAQALIRDAEIEAALKVLATPLIQAAGMNAFRTKILVIQADTLNAFVIDNQRVFLHSGLILRMPRPEMVQSVIAHELAHIANGHLARRRFNLNNAATAARLGALLAVAAGVAGAGDAAGGIAVGTSSAAQRAFMAHTRAEESSADRTGVRLMIAAGVDPQGAVDAMGLFAGQENLATARRDQYARTHPVSRDRMRNLQLMVEASRRQFVTREIDAYWFERLRAKLEGFIRAPAFVLRKAGSDRGEIATLRRAIAYHRIPDIGRALAEVDRLIAMRPDDPYYHELKGQFLLEAGRAAPAVAAYGQAAELSRGNALILAGLGRAQLALGTRASLKDAKATLEKARSRDPFDARMLRDLALVYARTGEKGMAAVVTAERYALLGRFEDARINASRAVGLLPRGSNGALRAEDVLATAEIALKNRRRR